MKKFINKYRLKIKKQTTGYSLKDRIKSIYNFFIKGIKSIYHSLKNCFTNIFAIYFRDLRNIFTNYAAIVVIGGLLLIPSLYAWVNVAANWDPYANTGNIKIAVVNNDMGTVFNDQRINVGEKVAEELKTQTAIGWTIVSGYEGNYGLHTGQYYALIEIPADFSNDLTSYASTTPIKPQIIYRANQKANAIATKITDAAKTKLTNTIKSNIVKTVNTEIMKQLNDLAVEMTENKEEILTFVETINNAEEQIDNVLNQLDEETNNIKNIQDQLQQNKKNIDNLNIRIHKMHDLNNSVRNLSNESNTNLKQGIYDLSDNVATINEESRTIDENLDKIIAAVNDSENQQQALDMVNTMIEANETISDNINSAGGNIDDAITDEDIRNNFLNLLDAADSGNAQTTQNLNTLKNDIESGAAQENIVNTVNIAKDANAVYRGSVNQLYDFFLNVVIPLSDVTTKNIESHTRYMDTYLTALKVINPQVKATSDFGIAMGNITNNQMIRAHDNLIEQKEKVGDISEITSKINEEFLDDTIELMSKDPEVFGNFLADPIEVKQVDIYGTKPFGVGVAPFYTVLGIWVGILLMLALLNVEVHPFKDGREISYIQWHFGKMLLFLTIAATQTTICTVGEILFLNIHPMNAKLFFGLAYLCCLVFTVMIYTLVSLFGDVGKAITVIIMVFQIAGSGGLYPVQLNPEIFGKLKGFWPFYYAIDAFRQAISSPNWATTAFDVHRLLMFLCIFFILGFFKRFVFWSTEFFENEFKKAGL